MELWIRSQDRTTLEKIDTIQICQNPDNTWFFNTGLVIGKYKTKERALEVLDEIQNILKPQMIITKPSVKTMSFDGEFVIREKGEAIMQELSTYVYEMPKE